MGDVSPIRGPERCPDRLIQEDLLGLGRDILANSRVGGEGAFLDESVAARPLWKTLVNSPTGIPYVIINGVPVVDDHSRTDTTPGSRAEEPLNITGLDSLIANLQAAFPDGDETTVACHSASAGLPTGSGSLQAAVGDSGCD